MHRYIFVIISLILLANQPANAGQLWQIHGQKADANSVQSAPNSAKTFEKFSISLDQNSIFSMNEGAQAEMSLPGGLQVFAQLESIKSHALGGDSWLGWAGEGDSRGRIVMTSVNGFTFAAITHNNKLYLIEPAKTGGHILYEASAEGMIEPSFGEDGVIPPVALTSAIAAKPPSPAKPTVLGALGTVDVGIFYHASMRDRWGLGLMARLQFLIQNYDTALLDSLTEVRANLVHVSEITGTLAKSNGDTLDDLKDGASNADGDFSGVAAIRAAKGIDIVTYMRRFKASTHSSCGTGFVLGTGSSVIGVGSAAFGVNTVSDSFDIDDEGPDGAPLPGPFSLCSIYTLAHEIGHNMGTQHNLATTPDDGVFSYSHGHRVEGDFRTIMGTDGSGGTTRLGFYSNPSLAKCTDPGGAGATTACGVVDVADAARSMREQGKNVGTFNAPAPRVVSSVLPISRSIKSDATATAFATVINPAGGGTATDCMLDLPGATAGQFSYQTTSAVNALTGTPDTPIDIAAGAAQNFIFSITPGAVFGGVESHVSDDPFTSSELAVDFSCTNRQSAESISGLNTLNFVAETTDVMDVIALSATIGSTGIVETAGGTGVFSVAVSNIGIAGTVTASGETSTAAVPATITVCETVPATGACKAPAAPTVTKTLAKDETATFGFFVTETATIANDLAANRILALFEEGGTTRGATSVAVRTGP